MRTLSADGLRELLAQESSHVFVPALVISHPSYAATVRVVADGQDMTYGGNTYTALPFECALAPDVDDQLPTVRIRIDNIERSLIEELRSYSDPPTIQLQVFRRYPPDWAAELEIDGGTFDVISIVYNVTTIEATLGLEANILDEPACAVRFDPTVAPGLY